METQAIQTASASPSRHHQGSPGLPIAPARTPNPPPGGESPAKVSQTVHQALQVMGANELSEVWVLLFEDSEISFMSHLVGDLFSPVLH